MWGYTSYWDMTFNYKTNLSIQDSIFHSCTFIPLLWFIEVKNIKNTSFKNPQESATSLFYLLTHKYLLQNNLQILSLNPPLESRKIDLITQDSVFINFNYTKTLENLYGINSHNILHIHGCVDEDEDEDENFILGHGKSYKELESMNTVDLPKPPEDLSSEELYEFYEEHADDGQMLHEQLAKDGAISGVASQRKPVEEIIAKHSQFFNSLATITNVHVYGMSLSEVDLPYLKHILSIARFAEWEFSDYNGDNYKRIVDFCKNNNIVDYNIINLEDLIDQ